MPVPGVADSPTTFSGGGLADYSGLHSALLACKVWSTAASSYVWSGDGIAPDPLSYTQILFVDPGGGHDPTTSLGGRSNVNDLWETGAAGTTVATDTLWDTKGDLAAATGPDAAVKLPVGSNNQVLTADSAQSTGMKWATPSGAGGALLGSCKYNPGTTATYNITSATLVDVDATNLKVTFTAPSTGNVVVGLCALIGLPTGNSLFWGLRSAGANVIDSSGEIEYVSASPGIETRRTYRMLITGLTASSSYTFTWAALRNSGSSASTIYAGGTAGGPAVMEVWSA